MAAQKAMWTAWLAVLPPAASLKAPMSSGAGPSFATFAFEHPPDVLHGATSESLYVEDNGKGEEPPRAGAKPSILADKDGGVAEEEDRMAERKAEAERVAKRVAEDEEDKMAELKAEAERVAKEEGERLDKMAELKAEAERVAKEEPRAGQYPAGWGPTGPTGGGAPASGAISATGDPHLQNVHGERFDLMRPGRHVLIHIPRGDPAERALLRVEAEARRLGGQCADMYFTELNITGAWVRARQAGGLSLAQADLTLVEARQASSLLFKALGAHEEHPDWMKLGRVDLKVVHGRTQQGLSYLNFYVRHLGRSGSAVGGLLGEDDHTEAMTPSEACVERLSLVQSAEGDDQHAVASVAEASLD